jgi:hypothetical protein
VLKRSMRRVIDQVRLGIEDEDLLRLIKDVSTTEWSGLSKQALDRYSPEWNGEGLSVEELNKHGGREQRDYLLGIYGEQVVSVYHITGWHRGQERGRIAFDVTPAVEMAGAVGQPVPGGPWKRGEARPVRYFDTSTFVEHLSARGVLDTYDDAGDDAADRRMVEVVRALAELPRPPAATLSPLDGVRVTPDPRGGVRVTVPMGTKVTVVQSDH